MNQTETNELCGKVLIEEHNAKKELEAYRVKMEKTAEALEAIANRLRRLASAIAPETQLTDEAGRGLGWPAVDLEQAHEDSQKALALRQRLETLRIQKTRLDL
jgi:hypothetical protein